MQDHSTLDTSLSEGFRTVPLIDALTGLTEVLAGGPMQLMVVTPTQ